MDAAEYSLQLAEREERQYFPPMNQEQKEAQRKIIEAAALHEAAMIRQWPRYAFLHNLDAMEKRAANKCRKGEVASNKQPQKLDDSKCKAIKLVKGRKKRSPLRFRKKKVCVSDEALAQIVQKVFHNKAAM